eukprot:maker-scaffold_44-snap-gene-1.91-mRNA-1 protein AED:0.01 eAED:0.01 QI:75/1/1/1/1/1/3/422/328
MKRKTKRKKKQPKRLDSNSNYSKKTTKDELFEFLRNITIITIVICLPYGLYLSYYWLRLKSGLLRPRVELTTERQVIIFGVQGSGTSDTSEKLNQLGFEVAHETSDALENFARDGTISWIHFVAAQKQEINTDLLCRRPRERILHSIQFEASDSCSYRKLWNNCWRDHCKKVFKKWNGCMYKENGCETKFRKQLVQVRNPLKNIASLVVKFCTTAKKDSVPHPDIYEVIASLFPTVDFEKYQGCIDIFTKYWIEYYAVVSGIAYYQIENTSPKEIAEFAGFHPTMEINTKTKVNEVNKGRLRLTLQNISSTLVEDLLDISAKYGYKLK